MSRGYQRLWGAGDGGEQIRVLDKLSQQARTIGTRDAFVEKNFSSYLHDGHWNDELEDEWRRLENFSIPHVRRLVDGDRGAEPRQAMKVLASVHYVRSYQFIEMLDSVVDAERRSSPARLAMDPEVTAVFRMDKGRDPHPGEIEKLVEATWIDRHESRRFVVEQMVHGYASTFALLEPLHVQLIWPATPAREFVLGDVPIVAWDRDGNVGALGGVALGDADRVLFPLGRRLAALFTTRPFADCPVEDERVEHLNRQSYRLARRLVGAHPDANMKRCLSRHAFTIVS